MGVVGRLDQYASMLAGEFDEYSMSENLFLYSEQYNQSSWINQNSFETINAIASPDGLTTAEKLIGDNGQANRQSIYQTVSVTSGTTYTFSVFLKQAERRYATIWFDNASITEGAYYGSNNYIDLQTGTIANSQTQTKIVAYPSGWYRCYVTATPSFTGSLNLNTSIGTANNAADGAGTIVYQYTGDGVSGFYISKGQFERGTLTDYTPTIGATISRILPATTNTNITGLGTYYSSGFDENVGFTTFLSANIFPPYDIVYDDFGGTLFGAGQGRYMRQNTDKSVIVYNEIDEITDFRDIVRTGLVLDLDAGMNASYNGSGTTWTDLSGIGNNGTRTNNGGYGGQVTYSSSGFFDFSMNSPASTATALAGNGFTMSSMIIPSTGSFTLSVFVRRNLTIKAAGDRETIFSNTGSADGWRFGLGDTGYIYYLIGGVGGSGYQEGALGGSTLNNGNWHMMTAVFDRAAQLGSYTIYGYIDGVASGNAAIGAGAGGNVAFSTQNPGIGYGGCCDVFAGQIATVSAYNRALSATEIAQNYNALRNRFGL